MKKEVIDIADQVDTMANQMNEQNFTISNMQYTLNKQDQKIENIFNMLNKFMVQNNRSSSQNSPIQPRKTKDDHENNEVDYFNHQTRLQESSQDSDNHFRSSYDPRKQSESSTFKSINNQRFSIRKSPFYQQKVAKGKPVHSMV